MQIFEKRGTWYLVQEGEDYQTFDSEAEAKKAAGWIPPVEEILDGGEEEEEEDCEEEASTDE
mgnify:CR=1 FL=1